ncbi:Piso0_001476 [Millerozyma farinosa CBS 7064]|uniref:Piso0_001476 protein n=1 Tax=Pichia sorbitophila (strain ATCC MYA-4447 / BCRC 22081 / CBS 7064 / NBRC 10061 / NRRL Y-12695) TaxID=559304 RepID=G8YN97_PICSO|nr:Piso0_001476 [Millerozyma farinosa CBS 7064]
MTRSGGLLNLFKGHPSQELLPATEIAEAFKHVLVNQDSADYDDVHNRHPLTYGTDKGNLDVRKTIATWSDRYFGRQNTDPGVINLTAGASYGILNILTSFTDTKSITRRAFIVTPTYYLINQTFLDVGFEGKLTAIEETAGGEYEVDLEYLEKQLTFYDQNDTVGDSEPGIIKDPTGRPDRKLYRYVMYLVPTFSNPGGLTYSLKTRRKLLEIARKHDLLLICDDVYDLLNYEDNPQYLPKLSHLDRDTLPAGYKFGNAVSNATFSKIIAPGLRVGWQETTTPSFAEQLAVTGANRSGGTPGQLATLVVKYLIESGKLDTIISGLIKAYSGRAEVLKKSLQEFFPDSLEINGGNGGYFVWVKIPGNFDHKKVVEEVAKEKAVLASGDNFEVSQDERQWGKHYVRLSISFLEEDDIREAIKIWADVLRKLHPEIYS